MKKLIEFFEEQYPKTTLETGMRIFLLARPEDSDYLTISTVSENGAVNLVDKFIYRSNKGEYIRVLTKTDRHKRLYLYDFGGELHG